MLRFSNSSISIRRNRFRETGSKFESVSINNIDIGNSFNSINYKDEFYTNFVNTAEQKVYKIIEKLYLEIKNNNIDILNNDYIADELYYNGNEIDRLIKIINMANDDVYTLSDLPNIYKFKNKKEPKIHLYIKILNNTISILLIDLFHLSIPGDLYSNHRFVKRIALSDLSNVYNKFKDYNYNLNSILKSNENKLQLVTQ